MDFLEQSACEGKSSFPSFSQARKAARRMRRRHASALAPYRCKHCGGWHIGTNPTVKAGQ